MGLRENYQGTTVKPESTGSLCQDPCYLIHGRLGANGLDLTVLAHRREALLLQRFDHRHLSAGVVNRVRRANIPSVRLLVHLVDRLQVQPPSNPWNRDRIPALGLRRPVVGGRVRSLFSRLEPTLSWFCTLSNIFASFLAFAS